MSFLYWIQVDKINWNMLSENPNAIHLLENNLDKINWIHLSLNPNAIHLLENNLDKINWYALSRNPNLTCFALHSYLCYGIFRFYA